MQKETRAIHNQAGMSGTQRKVTEAKEESIREAARKNNQAGVSNRDTAKKSKEGAAEKKEKKEMSEVEKIKGKEEKVKKVRKHIQTSQERRQPLKNTEQMIQEGRHHPMKITRYAMQSRHGKEVIEWKHGKGVIEWKHGDWTCGRCGDHQFANNKSCRKCDFYKDKMREREWARGDSTTATRSEKGKNRFQQLSEVQITEAVNKRSQNAAGLRFLCKECEVKPQRECGFCDTLKRDAAAKASSAVNKNAADEEPSAEK